MNSETKMKKFIKYPDSMFGFRSIKYEKPKRYRRGDLYFLIFSLPNELMWNLLILFMCVLDFILVTVRVTFDVPDFLSVCPTFVIVDVFYVINFFLLMHHKFSKKLEHHSIERTATSPVFLTTDLLTILSQIVVLLPLYNADTTDVILHLRLLNVLRLRNIAVFRDIRNSSNVNSRLAWILFEHFLMFFLFLHSFICVRCVGFVKYDYWRCFYEVFLVFVGLGADSFDGTSWMEIFFILVIVFTMVCFFACFIADLQTHFVCDKFNRTVFFENVCLVRKYLQDLPDSRSKTHLKIYYANLWKYYRGFNLPSALDLLPDSSRMEVFYDINCGLVIRSLLLREMPKFVQRKLATGVKHMILSPGDAVYFQNVVKHGVIFVENGVLDVMSDENGDAPLLSFKRGTVLGEISLFMNVPSRATVRASKFAEIKILEKSDFMSVMADYPTVLMVMRRKLTKRIDEAMADRLTNRKTSDASLKKLYYHLKVRKYGYEDAVDDTGLKTDNLDLYNLDVDHQSTAKSKASMGNRSPCVLKETCMVMKIWKVFTIFVQLVYIVLLPYCVIFERDISIGVIIFGIFADTMCFFDVVARCITEINLKDKTLNKITSISHYRLQEFSFCMDVFSLFPIEVWSFLYEFPLEQARFYQVLQLNRVLRVWRIKNLAEICSKKTSYACWVMKCALYIATLIYYSACLLYLTACFEDFCDDNSWIFAKFDENSTGKFENTYRNPFLSSLYFATTAALQSGLSDVSPLIYQEKIVVVLSAFIGVVLKAYFVAQICSSLFLTQICTGINERNFFIKRLTNYFKLSKTLTVRIKRCFVKSYVFEKTQGGTVLADTTPSSLRSVIQTAKIANSLSNMSIFQYADVYFVSLMVKHAEITQMPPNETVYYYGDISRRMYVLQDGYCEQYSAEGALLKTLGPGSEFGVVETIFGVPKCHTIVTSGDCRIITIDYKHYSRLLNVFPKEKETVGRLMNDENVQKQMRRLKVHRTVLKKDFTLFERASFVFSAKHWDQYWSIYARKLGFFRFVGVFFIPMSVKPNGVFLKLWYLTRCLMIVGSCVLLPVSVAAPPFADQFYLPCFIMACCMYVDVYFMMHVSYYNKEGLLVSHPLYTFRNYLTRNFILDFMTAFPLERVIQLVNTSHDGGHDFYTHVAAPHVHHCLWKLLGLLQVYRVYVLLSYFEKKSTTPWRIFKVVGLVFFLLVFVNVCSSVGLSVACKFVFQNISKGNTTNFLGYDEEIRVKLNNTYHYGSFKCGDDFEALNGNFGPFETYVIFFYTVTNFVTNIGLEGLEANTFFTKLSIVIVSFIGYLFFVVLTAIIANISLQKISPMEIASNDKFLVLLSYLRHQKISPDLLENIKRYYEHLYRNFPVDEYFLNSKRFGLPDALIDDVFYYQYQDVLEKCFLGKKRLGKVFTQILARHAKILRCFRGQIVVRPKDVSSDIFLLTKGRCQILNKNEELLVTLGPSAVFGNLSPNTYACSRILVIVKENAELLVVPRAKLLEMVQFYADIEQKLMAVLKDDADFYLQNRDMDEEDKLGSLYLHDNEYGDDVDMIMGVEESTAINFLNPGQWCKFSLNPGHILFQISNHATFACSLLSIIAIPYLVATQDPSGYFHIVFLAEVIFYLRIFFKFHKRYETEEGYVIKSNQKIARRYFSRPFAVVWDVVPNLPIFAFCFVARPPNWTFYCTCLRSVQLLRIYYVVRYFSMYDKKIPKRYWIQTVKVFVYYLISIHMFACTWLLITCPFGKCKLAPVTRNKNIISDEHCFGKFLLAFYYVTSLMTSVGIGDVRPETTYEYIFTIFIMIFGKIFLAVITARVTSTLYYTFYRKVMFDNRAFALKQYLENQETTEFQTKKTLNYLTTLWKKQNGCFMPQLIREMPYVLQCDLMFHLYGDFVKQHALFQNVSRELLRQICVKLDRKIFTQGDYIVRNGVIDFCIYFIDQGLVSVLTTNVDNIENEINVLKSRDIFGAAKGLNNKVAHQFSYRAEALTVVLVLDYNSWGYLLKHFPNDEQIIYQN